MERALHTLEEYGADASLHRLVLSLCDFDAETRKRADSGEQKNSAIRKMADQNLELQEDTFEAIKSVLERQNDVVTDLTTQMTLLEGVALEVCEPVTQVQFSLLTKPTSIAILRLR